MTAGFLRAVSLNLAGDALVQVAKMANVTLGDVIVGHRLPPIQQNAIESVVQKALGVYRLLVEERSNGAKILIRRNRKEIFEITP